MEKSKRAFSEKLSFLSLSLLALLGSACNTTAKEPTLAERKALADRSALQEQLAAAGKNSGSTNQEPASIPGAGSVADQQPSEDDSPPRFDAPREKDLNDEEAGVKITLTPNEAPDGGLVFMRIALDAAKHAGLKAEDVVVKFEEQRGAVFPMASNEFGAVVPMIFNSKPRRSKFEVVLPKKTVELDYEVVDGKYRSEILSVAPKFTSPSKKDLARIARETKEVGAIYRSVTKERYWTGKFSLPIESKMTSPFGTKRVFNGELKSFHQGTDLRARTPTPILAPENGVVVLAKDLFFSGGSVIIDHGYGLYTLYAHMSKIQVKPGQKLKRGERLGLSGATGRIQAPHLHWGAVVQGAKVNPLDLVRVLPEPSRAVSENEGKQLTSTAGSAKQ